jgi:transcriptional regulator NrdR family protein
VIACPSCGADTKSLETRQAGRGALKYTRRRRECVKCHRRVTTTEVIVPNGTSGDIMIIKAAKMRALLHALISTFAVRTDGVVAADLVDRLFPGVGRTDE